MVQEGYLLDNTNRYENEESLKKYLNKLYTEVREWEYQFNQTTTAAFVEWGELGGLTITRTQTTNLAILLDEEADVAADRSISVTFSYMDEDGALIEDATLALDASDTTTNMTGPTDFCYLRKMTFPQVAGKYIRMFTA